MKVRAIRQGYHDNKRRREGDEFELKPIKGYGFDDKGVKIEKEFSVEQQFSEKWMEKIEGDVEPVVKKSKKKAVEQVESFDDEVI